MVFWDLPTGSTTGAPEGDSLSVLAMLAPATAFHWSISNESVSPHGYADNWGRSTFNFASQLYIGKYIGTEVADRF